GVKTIKMAAKLASYLRCAVLETEVCQPEKATGSIGDETAHTVGSLGCTRMLSAAAGFLRAPAAAPPARRQDGPPGAPRETARCGGQYAVELDLPHADQHPPPARYGARRGVGPGAGCRPGDDHPSAGGLHSGVGSPAADRCRAPLRPRGAGAAPFFCPGA